MDHSHPTALDKVHCRKYQHPVAAANAPRLSLDRGTSRHGSVISGLDHVGSFLKHDRTHARPGSLTVIVMFLSEMLTHIFDMSNIG